MMAWMRFLPRISNGRGRSRSVRCSLWIGFVTIAVVLPLSDCRRDIPSENSIKAASESDGSIALQRVQQASLPLCPPGLSEGTSIAANEMHHKVVLTWNPPVSAGHAGNQAIGYCLYRTRQQILVKKLRDCTDCERVTPKPIIGTGCVDPIVQDGKTYFYAALTINPENERSDFSNQTIVVIPPNKESDRRPTSLPSCREQPGSRTPEGQTR